ncbi:MAG: CocE/NonD family hydrolase [Actinomycetota bacterium]
MGRRLLSARRRLMNARRPRVTVLPAPAGVITEWDVPVPVRDGTLLRANVFRPDTPGPVPVIMSAHPYGKDHIPANTRRESVSGQYHAFPQPHPIQFSEWTSWEAPDPASWVAQGYAVVNADLRGAGTSEGTGELLSRQEAQDYHDLIEWAGTQTWSTGKVGLLGVSYLAISQYGAAATHPPHLAAICPWEGFSDVYRDFAYPGGVREDGFSIMWSAITDRETRMREKIRPQLVANPEIGDWYAVHTPRLEDIEVPMLVCGSFSDHNLHSRGSFEAFRRATSPQRWLYTHRDGKWAAFYSSEAFAAQLRFFDHFLKGDDNGWNAVPPVRLAIHDHGPDPVAVTAESAWPPPDVVWTDLSLDLRDHRMTLDAVPVPESDGFSLTNGDLRLTWQAHRDTDLIGPMVLRLWVGLEDTSDAHLFVGVRKIRDGGEVVFEGSYGFGFDMITIGWQRVALRTLDPALSTPWLPVGAFDEPQPVRPGEIVPLDIALLPQATRMRAGDSLRLEIRGHWHYARNPLTGQFPAGYRKSPAGRCIVHAGGDYDSHLIVGMRDVRDEPAWPVTP